MRITNLYAPNSPPTSYFQELSTWLGSHEEKLHYIAGDFNCTVVTSEDRTKRINTKANKSKPLDDTLLSFFLSSMQLTDLWRCINPTERQYTYYSPPHDSFSRIDYTRCRNAALSGIHRNLRHCDFGPCIGRPCYGSFPQQIEPHQVAIPFVSRQGRTFSGVPPQGVGDLYIFQHRPRHITNPTLGGRKGFHARPDNGLHFPLQKRKGSRI